MENDDFKERKPFCESCKSKDITIIDDCECMVVDIKCNTCGKLAEFCKIDFDDFDISDVDFDDDIKGVINSLPKKNEIVGEMIDIMAEFIPNIDEDKKEAMFEDLLEMIEEKGKEKNGKKNMRGDT